MVFDKVEQLFLVPYYVKIGFFFVVVETQSQKFYLPGNKEYNFMLLNFWSQQFVLYILGLRKPTKKNL